MSRTSDKPELILRFIREYSRDKGYPPTVREIGAAVGLASTASVHHQLRRLQDAGKLNYAAAKTRSVTLSGAEHAVVQIPVLGVVTAGMPILAVENIEGYLPWENGEGCFALRVRGDSMVGAGILSGDKVVVRPQETAESGQIVVALLGEEATVKRLWKKGPEVMLLPENPAYDPIDGREARILGLVKAVVREY